MAAKPRIAIVGAGSFGSALAAALQRASYPIDVIVGRPKSLEKPRKLAKQTGARAATDLNGSNADLIWFCVPDSEIANAARSLAKTKKDFRKGSVALHSSGALTSDELDVLCKRGVAVASVHPLMTFVRGSHPELTGVSFAIEGDARAVRVAQRIVRDLGGEAYPIRRKAKAAYHAWATFASPLLTALLAATEQVASLAGVKTAAARRRMTPILRQTLANYVLSGAADAFSGPIIRGDAVTVQQHLTVLRKLPAARELYLALARAALQYLPSRNKKALTRVLRTPQP